LSPITTSGLGVEVAQAKAGPTGHVAPQVAQPAAPAPPAYAGPTSWGAGKNFIQSQSGNFSLSNLRTNVGNSMASRLSQWQYGGETITGKTDEGHLKYTNAAKEELVAAPGSAQEAKLLRNERITRGVTGIAQEVGGGASLGE